MMELTMIDRHKAEHYPWGQNCDGWHLLKSSEFSIIQERMPSNTSEIRHIHNKSHQFFFILSGEATMEVNGEVQRLQVDQGIEIQPQTPRQMMNKSNDVLEFLVVSCPPSHGDRINV
jgi:mannose-6-phosphate isomerase-like protein (cupin superfamily)